MRVLDTNKFVRLVHAAQRGDQCAWASLHDMTNGYVLSIARSRFRLSTSSAEDVSQDVWIRLYRAVGRIEQPAALLGWLRRTTSRQCLSMLETAWSRHVVPADDVAAGACDEVRDRPAERHERAEVTAAVRDAVSRTEGVGARVIELQLIDPDLSYSEISDQLGIPVGSIGPQRGRALRRLARDPAIRCLAAS